MRLEKGLPGICWLEIPIRGDHLAWASIRSESDGAAYLTAKGMTVPFGRGDLVRNYESSVHTYKFLSRPLRIARQASVQSGSWSAYFVSQSSTSTKKSCSYMTGIGCTLRSRNKARSRWFLCGR